MNSTLPPGVILRQLRVARGESQQALGAELGIDQSRFSRIEDGIALPTLRQAAAIESRFGIPASAWATVRTYPVRTKNVAA